MKRHHGLWLVLAAMLCGGCGGGGAGDDCDDGADCGDEFYCLYRSADDDLGQCTDAPSGCTTPVGCGCEKAKEVCEDVRACTGDDEDPATVKCS